MPHLTRKPQYARVPTSERRWVNQVTGIGLIHVLTFTFDTYTAYTDQHEPKNSIRQSKSVVPNFFFMPTPLKIIYDVLAPLTKLIIKNIQVFSCNLLQEKMKKLQRSIKQMKCLDARLNARTPWNAISHSWSGNPGLNQPMHGGGMSASQFSRWFCQWVVCQWTSKPVLNDNQEIYFSLVYHVSMFRPMFIFQHLQVCDKKWRMLKRKIYLFITPTSYSFYLFIYCILFLFIYFLLFFLGGDQQSHCLVLQFRCAQTHCLKAKDNRHAMLQLSELLYQLRYTSMELSSQAHPRDYGDQCQP